MSYPLPPDTRAAGTGNPPADMDQVIDALTGMGERGYIKPSGDVTGATDTAAVAAAEAAGGTVYFGPATYWGNFTKQANVHWQGSGRGSTILKAPAASNAPVLTSAGFAAQTLTGSVTAGISAFAIRDLTFDGNASAQTAPAAFGAGIYGCDYLLENVSIRNCLAADALYTEFGIPVPATFPDKSMESMYRFLRIHDNTCTGADWHDRGPHDSGVYGCWIYNGTSSQYGYWPEAPFSTYTAAGLSGTAVSSTPAAVTLNSAISLPAAGTATIPSAGGTVTLTWTGTTATTLTGVTAAGGSGNYTSNTVTPVCAYSAAASMVYGMHVWGNHSIGIVADASVLFNGCESEGAATGQVLLRSGTQWNGGRVFSGNAASGYGFQIGDTVNQATSPSLNWPILSGFTGGVSSKAYINVVNEAQGHYEAHCLLSGTSQAVYGTFATASHRKIIFEGGGSTTPAIAAASGAGTSPPAPTLGNATDLRGQISMGTGTTPLAAPANQVLLTFAQPKPGTPAISIWPLNAATAALGPYVANWSATGFNIGFNVTPAASQATGTYQVGYADVTG